MFGAQKHAINIDRILTAKILKAHFRHHGTDGNTNQGVQQPYEIYSVGIDESMTTISLITYPNPTTDYLVLEFTDYSNEKMEYHLIDLNGKTIIKNSISSSKTQIDLNTYSKGIYFIKIIKELKEIKTFKIIKN